VNPVAAASKKADHDYRRFDWHREREHLWSEVQRLTNCGVSANTIAQMVGIEPRSVVRIRSYDVPEHTRPVFDQSEERADALEAMADTMLRLACQLRDEDPVKTWETLGHLQRQELAELTMIALAAIDPDKTKTELLGWVQ
jgi:hypothetical protein